MDYCLRTNEDPHTYTHTHTHTHTRGPTHIHTDDPHTNEDPHTHTHTHTQNEDPHTYTYKCPTQTHKWGPTHIHTNQDPHTYAYKWGPTHIRIQMRTHTHTNEDPHTYTYKRGPTHIQMRTHTHTHTNEDPHTYAYKWGPTHIRIQMRPHTRTHIHIHTSTHKMRTCTQTYTQASDQLSVTSLFQTLSCSKLLLAEVCPNRSEWHNTAIALTRALHAHKIPPGLDKSSSTQQFILLPQVGGRQLDKKAAGPNHFLKMTIIIKWSPFCLACFS